MNKISQAGLALAEVIASAYAESSEVQAIMAGGSVSRGCADHFSDLEIGVFWTKMPSAEARKSAISQIGGELWSFSDESGNEHYGLSRIKIGEKQFSGTAMISTHHMTVTDVETCLTEVIDHCNSSANYQVLLSAIQQAVPMSGAKLVQEWQARAGKYPDKLAIKIIQENLWFGPWFCPEAYISRDDMLVFFQHFIVIEQSILKLLAALNRVYYPSIEHKWMDELIGRLEITPPHLSSRMKQVFKIEPMEGWQQLKRLMYETLALIETHLPEVDRISLFEDHPEVNFTWAKQRWDTRLPYTLMAEIANS